MAFTFSSLLARNAFKTRKKASQNNLMRLIFPYSGLSFWAPLKAQATNQLRFQHAFHTFPSSVARTARNAASKEKGCISFLLKGATIAGVGLGLANQRNSILHCDGPESKPKPPPFVYPVDRGPPPESSVSLYELGFGTVAGICAGVFVKKGAKAVAFVLGGIFVLLQYLGSSSLVRVDWARMSSKFENLFYTKDALTGATKPPNIFSLWKWLINFLTVDFQPRASFVAGFALGLRAG